MIGSRKPARLRPGPLAAVALALAAIVLVPAGAGAQTEGEAEGDAEMTREGYVAAAEPICQENVRRNAKVLKGVKKQIRRGKTRKAARRFNRAAKLFNKALNQVDAIEKPAADAATLERWLGVLRKQVPLLRRMAKMLRKKKLNRAQKIRIKLNRNGRKANEIVLGYGFDFCLVKPGRFN